METEFVIRSGPFGHEGLYISGEKFVLPEGQDRATFDARKAIIDTGGCPIYHHDDLCSVMMDESGYLAIVTPDHDGPFITYLRGSVLRDRMKFA